MTTPDGRVEGQLTCVLYGFGRINRLVFDLAARRPWLHVSAALARSPRIIDRPSDGAAAVTRSLSVETDPERVYEQFQPDVTIVATRTRLADVLPHLRMAVPHSRAVLCTAEELAFVAPDDPRRDELHALALKEGSRIVAVGVNPGFLFDRWALAALAPAWTADKIEITRVVPVASFPAASRRHLGIGVSPAELEAGLSDGSIAGHVGFEASVAILSAALGRSTDVGAVSTRPIFADEDLSIDDLTIPKGHTIGIEQRVVGESEGREWIRLSLLFHVAPAQSGLEAMDELRVTGLYPLTVRIPGGINPAMATAALLVNSIPTALQAGPGYHPSGSLPLPAPWLGVRPPIDHLRSPAWR